MSCPAGVSPPVTVTVCTPSLNPLGSFDTQASVPCEAGGAVQVCSNSVAVTPPTGCRPVGSPATGLPTVMVPSR